MIASGLRLSPGDAFNDISDDHPRDFRYIVFARILKLALPRRAAGTGGAPKKSDFV
jgi:hypothetical protein